jgi:hypothetical protein
MPGDKDGDAPPENVTLPGALAAGERSITLVGQGGARLAVRAGTNGTTLVEFPTAAVARPPCANAWALKIAPVQPAGAK